MRRRGKGYKRPPSVASWKRQVREAHERGDTATLMHLSMNRPPGVEDDPELMAEANLTRVIESQGKGLGS